MESWFSPFRIPFDTNEISGVNPESFVVDDPLDHTNKYQKLKINQTVAHIESTRPKERIVIDAAYLSDFALTTHKYLITMVDHFSKYGWAK